MRSRPGLRIAALVTLVIAIAHFMPPAFGGDKDPPPTVTKASSPSPAVKWQSRPQLGAFIFYSKKADTGSLATPHSRQRLKHALIGMRLAKKTVEEGGLGLCGETTGALSVEENWDRFVNGLMLPPTIAGESEADRRAEAEREAEALRPFLQRGGTVLVIASEAKDDKWLMPYGPLNMATDVSAQIKFAITELDQVGIYHCRCRRRFNYPTAWRQDRIRHRYRRPALKVEPTS
jgi:hypothetical protein